MQVNGIEILVGADPEMFMKDHTGFVSAHGMIKGSKNNPSKVLNGAVQVDGMALEFNIDPAKSKQEFLTNVKSVMSQLKGMVKGYELVACPVADFSAKVMATVPKEALDLGCEADYNAWNDGKVFPKPNVYAGYRTGAGHLHIGWTEGQNIYDIEHKMACIYAAQQLDLYLGVPSIIFDEDTRRREMYGKAGCYRPKNYGVEYRTLSNAWLRDEVLMDWVYSNTTKAMEDLLTGDFKYDPEVQRVINESDKVAAIALCERHGIPMPKGY